MTSLAIFIFSLSQNIDVNYACKDQHVDATFSNYEQAVEYVEYFKPHHHYEIIPIFKINGSSN